MAENDNKNPTPAKPEKKIKAGDTVNLVTFCRDDARRIGRKKVEAVVDKVHDKGVYLDLSIPHEDPDQVVKICKSPRDDTGTKCDSWHPIEG